VRGVWKTFAIMEPSLASAMRLRSIPATGVREYMDREVHDHRSVVGASDPAVHHNVRSGNMRR